MATLNSTFTPKAPKLRPAHGGGGPIDHGRGGGGGGGGGRGDNHPDFGEQLRRGRLAMAIGLTAVFMLFISFSTAFVVRQAMGRWDIRTQSYISDWKHIPLPYGLFAVNTLVLLISSVTLEMSRRRTFREAALAPAMAIPGIAVHSERGVPWLELTVFLGFGFLFGQLMAWRDLAKHGLYLSNSPDQFVCLHDYRHARPSSRWRSGGSPVCRHCAALAHTGPGAPPRGRGHHRLVLALYDGAVGHDSVPCWR